MPVDEPIAIEAPEDGRTAEQVAVAGEWIGGLGAATIGFATIVAIEADRLEPAHGCGGWCGGDVPRLVAFAGAGVLAVPGTWLALGGSAAHHTVAVRRGARKGAYVVVSSLALATGTGLGVAALTQDGAVANGLLMGSCAAFTTALASTGTTLAADHKVVTVNGHF